MATLLDLIFKVDHSQVDKAQEAVKGLGDKTKTTASAGEHLETIFAGMGGAVGEAVEHVSRFNNTMSKMLESMEHLATTSVKNIGGLGALGSELLALTGVAAGLAAVLGLVGIAMAFEAYEHIENLADTAAMFGYTASQVQTMSEAARRAGSSLEAVEMTYVKVAKAAYNANDPLKGTGAAFHSLGIDIKNANGELKSAQELTNEAVEKWKEGAQTTEDFAATSAVLGKGWEKNLPALEAVNEANKVANELQQEGIGISTQSIDAVEKHTKATGRLHAIMADVGSKLVEIVLPAFTNLVKWFTRSYETGGLVAGIFGVLEGATWLLMVALKALMTVMQGLEFIISTLMKGVGAVAAALMMIVHGDFAGAKNAWAEYLGDVRKSAVETNKSLDDLWKGQEERTIEKNKPGNAGKEGGDAKAKPQHGIISAATKDEADMFEKYLDTLRKMLEVKQNFNQEEKAAAEIAKLELDYAKQTKEVNDHNAQVIKNGRGQLKQVVGREVVDAEIAQIKDRSKAVDEAHAKNIIEIEDYKKMDDFVTRYNNTIDDEIRHRRMTKEAIGEENAIKAIQKQLDDDILKLQQQHLWTQEREDQLRVKATASINAERAATERLVAANKDWLNNGINAFIVGLGTMEQGLEKITTKGLQDFSDTLYTLVTTGKNGFKEMVASMLDQIAKLVFQMYVIIPLMNQLKASMNGGSGIFGTLFSGIGKMFGGAGGSSGFTTAQMAAGAEGGDIGSNNNNGGSILVGEKGPEMFVPRGAGSIVPNSKLNVGGGSNTQINNNLTVSIGSVDSNERKQELLTEIQKMMINTSKQTLANEMRQGGMLNRRATA